VFAYHAWLKRYRGGWSCWGAYEFEASLECELALFAQSVRRRSLVLFLRSSEQRMLSDVTGLEVENLISISRGKSAIPTLLL